MKPLCVMLCALAFSTLLAPPSFSQQYVITATVTSPASGTVYSGSPNSTVQVDMRSLHSFRIINGNPGAQYVLEIKDYLMGEGDQPLDGGSHDVLWPMTVGANGDTDTILDNLGGTYNLVIPDGSDPFTVIAGSDGSSNPAVPRIYLPQLMPAYSSFSLYGEG